MLTIFNLVRLTLLCILILHDLNTLLLLVIFENVEYLVKTYVVCDIYQLNYVQFVVTHRLVKRKEVVPPFFSKYIKSKLSLKRLFEQVCVNLVFEVTTFGNFVQNWMLNEKRNIHLRRCNELVDSVIELFFDLPRYFYHLLKRLLVNATLQQKLIRRDLVRS